MAGYLETTEELQKAVSDFIETRCVNYGQGWQIREPCPEAEAELDHIVDLAKASESYANPFQQTAHT